MIIALGGCARLAQLEAPDDAEVESDAASRTALDDGDASTPSDAGAPVAHFAITCNGKPYPLHRCQDKRWEYEPCPAPSQGSRSVILTNTGPDPIAYIARQSWPGKYVPGVPSGGGEERLGTLVPGDKVDLSASYNGGYLMLLGSVHPFDENFTTSPKTDEGTIPWTKGIGGVPTKEMFIAQLTTTTQGIGPCTVRQKLF